MEINKPDLGIFKGMGRLETPKFINRKPFPHIRNKHQFEYTHNHPNQHKSLFSTFHKRFPSTEYRYEKMKNNPNHTQLVLGTEKQLPRQSWSKSVHKKPQNIKAPTLIVQPEEGVGINEYEERTGQKIKFSTTVRQSFCKPEKDPRQDVVYKYERAQRYNPITGQLQKSISFGFDDHVPKNDKKYKAFNATFYNGGGYDIISGRRLSYR